MNVLVIGAAGKSGQAVVRAAHDAGHTVTASVRTTANYQASNVTMIEGEATNTADMEKAVSGQDAVIITIGGKSPFHATDIERRAAAAVTSAMQKHEVRRLMVISMIGEGDSGANIPVILRWLLPSVMRAELKDKAAMESIVEASGLDWTIFRPPFLNDYAATGRVHVYDAKTKEKAHKITRADLAAFVIAQLTSNEHVHRAVTVANS